MKLAKSVKATSDFTSNQWDVKNLKQQVKNEKDAINDFKQYGTDHLDTYKFVSDSWSPSAMKNQVEVESKLISAVKNAKVEKHKEEISPKSENKIMKAISKSEAEDSGSKEKIKEDK